ncbi:MAG: TerB family tellurite resistance protein [Cyanobacteriota bacterium]|nr:TerB family tellurite resistance protein [Cyanobacteriota bacterium]
MTNNQINNQNKTKTTPNSDTNIDSNAEVKKELTSPNSLTDAAGQVGELIVNTATKTTQEVIENVAGAGILLQDFIETTSREAHQLLESATEQTGQTLQIISENPVLKFINKLWGTQWLMSILGEVDVEKIQTKVKETKLKYPQETPNKIANRLILKQAWEAGKVGMVTNILPPIALALFGVELAATTKLQSEMLYQIAGAYGLDLNEPTRRGEVLGIFGLSLGGSMLKGSLSFVEIIPGIGPVVGASTNAVMIYSLGYTACQFYEAKLNGTLNTEKLETFQQQTEDNLKYTEQQFVVIDQILAHMIIASYPNKSWSDIMSELDTIAPASIETVKAHLDNPQPLEILLEKLSPDLAMSVLAHCYRIAKLDGMITPEEQAILEAIAKKFEIDLSLLEIEL